jgi:serine/threonine protein kinase
MVSYESSSPTQDVNREWMFSEREIVISDTVLGKGAFGEVRVAKWRNIDVAAKRLHGLVAEQESDLDLLQFQNADIVDSFRDEMTTLSKLRHPNLVLFLGVGYNPRNRQPTTILTELLPGSLYDLLEVHKITLTLPEILDISLDIASGLEYLHSNNPQIVHRDISSKNILLGGNHAKITDLGQAKVFGATALSRQTAMPGAMAYSAPEVLTGKYTAKIDIFSYGILLIQMCSGEYPRLDRRDEQHKTAKTKFSPLAQLLTETIEYQPNARPTASRICELLKEIRNNDRYYPPARRLPPQSDIGTLARRWLEDTVETRCGDLRIALEQTSRRVRIEEQRWRDEAERVDTIFVELNQLKQKAETYEEIVTRKDREITQLTVQLAQLRRENEQNSLQIQSLLTEKDQLSHSLSSAHKKSSDLEVLLSVAKQESLSVKKDYEEMKAQYSQAKQSEFSSKSAENQTKFQLELQLDQCRELETRLEQTLSRWRQEKEQVMAETARCTKLRETCVELVEKDQRRKEEIDRLMSRLNMYNSLPLPEEIKARFRDNERDIERLSELSEELRGEKYQLQQSYNDLRQDYERLQEETQEVRSNASQLAKQMSVKDERISHLEEMVDELDQQMQINARDISEIERDKKNLMAITETIREELATAKDEVLAANAARRRAELDRNPKGGSTAPSVSGSRRKRGGRRQPQEQSETGDDLEESDSEDDEEEGDIFETETSSTPLLLPPPSSAAFQEVFDSETTKKILHDQQKLRRFSINTRLKKVQNGELGTAEADAIKENMAARFHTYGGGNFSDLVKSASSTHDHLLKLQESQQIGDQEDLAERHRHLDSQAKARVITAGERGGAKKIIECLWDHLDVSAPPPHPSPSDHSSASTPSGVVREPSVSSLSKTTWFASSALRTSATRC